MTPLIKQSNHSTIGWKRPTGASSRSKLPRLSCIRSCSTQINLKFWMVWMNLINGMSSGLISTIINITSSRKAKDLFSVTLNLSSLWTGLCSQLEMRICSSSTIPSGSVITQAMRLQVLKLG